MPRDLDQLAQDAGHQQQWGVPRWSGDLEALAGQQQMTHQPEQPNPAAPYLDAARGAAQTGTRFMHGGLTEAFPSIRQAMPGFANTLGDLVQSQSARDVFSTANFGGIPFGGIIKLVPGKEIFGMQTFKVMDQLGKWIGNSKMAYNPKQQSLYVGWLGTDDGPLSIGMKEMRTLIPEIERHYPDVRQIGAVRISGARQASRKEDMVINLYKHADGQWKFSPPPYMAKRPQLAPIGAMQRDPQ